MNFPLSFFNETLHVIHFLVGQNQVKGKLMVQDHGPLSNYGFYIRQADLCKPLQVQTFNTYLSVNAQCISKVLKEVSPLICANHMHFT